MNEPVPSPQALLVILSGPSGVGKDAVLARLKARWPSGHFVVTVTTRPRRPRERDGVDYFFVSPERFQEMVARGELLEHAQVYGHWYGVPREPVRRALAQGQDVIIKADVQGAATIKGLAPQAIFIFLAPASLEELEARLHHRHTEAPQVLARRLEIAREEMKRLPRFDYRVVNAEGQIEGAVAQIEAIVMAERCRVQPRRIKL